MDYFFYLDENSTLHVSQDNNHTLCKADLSEINYKKLEMECKFLSSLILYLAFFKARQKYKGGSKNEPTEIDKLPVNVLQFMNDTPSSDVCPDCVKEVYSL